MPLRGTLTVLDEPPRRVEIEAGGVTPVYPGSPLQLPDEADADILLFAYGGDRLMGNTEHPDDVPRSR